MLYTLEPIFVRFFRMIQQFQHIIMFPNKIGNLEHYLKFSNFPNCVISVPIKNYEIIHFLFFGILLKKSTFLR